MSFAQFAASFQGASDAVAVANAAAASVLRAGRAGRFTAPLLSGHQASCHHEVAAMLHAIRDTEDPRNICVLVLSAVAISYSPEAMASSMVALTIPTTQGLAGLRGPDGLVKSANKFTIFGKEYTPGPISLKAGSDEAVTQRDANAQLAIAVYAAGKRLTADNMPGILGSDTTKGRVGALKAVTGCNDLYLSGARALSAATIKKINNAFMLEPSARAALFSIVSTTLYVSLTSYEQVVASQARLLRSEGRGSFERAVLAVQAFGEILYMLPKYKIEMERLVVIIRQLAVESQVMRDYGYIIYQEAYETLRVSQFRQLAGMGILIMQAEPDTSAVRIKTPLSTAELTKATELYTTLAETFEKRITAVTEQAKKAAADAAAAAATAAPGS